MCCSRSKVFLVVYKHFDVHFREFVFDKLLSKIGKDAAYDEGNGWNGVSFSTELAFLL